MTKPSPNKIDDEKRS